MAAVNRTEPDRWLAPSWLLVVKGATLPHVWPIPLVVGTLLTAVNLGPVLMRGPDSRSLFAVGFNYLVPYIVSSLGFLRSQRLLVDREVGVDR